MIVIIKNTPIPALEQFKNRTAEIRVVVNSMITEVDGTIKLRPIFIDSQEELDNLPELCNIVSVLFEDGTTIKLPLEVFKSVFRIVPEGELTDAIYGNK